MLHLLPQRRWITGNSRSTRECTNGRLRFGLRRRDSAGNDNTYDFADLDGYPQCWFLELPRSPLGCGILCMVIRQHMIDQLRVE